MRRVCVRPAGRLMMAAVLMTGLLTGPRLSAQDTALEKTTAETEKPVYPVLSINVASVDHLFGRMNLVFDLIGRPELSDLVGAKLADFRDLKGLDRTRPLGLMLYLNDAAFLQPVPVAYLPVKDIGELKQTASTVRLQINDVPGEENRYELIPQRGGTQQGVHMKDYLFITQSALNLEQNFADPVEAQADLSRRYDIAITINLTHLPEAARNLLTTTLRASTQSAMQQRDDEPVGAYEFRRAQAEGNLQFLESLLKDGEEVTIGLKVDPDQKIGAVEFVIKAQANSGFSKELAESAGKPSYFAAALDETIPLNVSLSQNLNELQRKQTKKLLGIGEQEVNRGLAGLPREAKPEDIPKLESIRGLFDAVEATIENGHLDAFVQFFGNPKEKFVLVGGIRVAKAEAFGAGLTDVLTRARQSATDVDIELSVASYQDAVFHRLTGHKVQKNDQRLYGDKPSLLLGTDRNVLWFAVGGENSMTMLKSVMDKVAAGQAAPAAAQGVQPTPFQFVLHLDHFIGLRADEFEQNKEAKRNSEMAKEAFTNAGSDELRIDVKPIENGFRMRLQLQQGYLRLLGLAIARAVDRNTSF